MDEKIYHKDSIVKITNLRITCNHITVPIGKIENVIVDFKITTMLVAFTSFIFSVLAVIAVAYFYGHYGWIVSLLVIASLIWLRIIYLTYTELKISIPDRTFSILDASMRNREYIFKIETALKTAMLDTAEGREFII